MKQQYTIIKEYRDEPGYKLQYIEPSDNYQGLLAEARAMRALNKKLLSSVMVIKWEDVFKNEELKKHYEKSWEAINKQKKDRK